MVGLTAETMGDNTVAWMVVVWVESKGAVWVFELVVQSVWT